MNGYGGRGLNFGFRKITDDALWTLRDLVYDNPTAMEVLVEELSARMLYDTSNEESTKP